MKLSEAQKVGMFKMLASKPLYEVGVEYGLDKHYSSPTAVRNKVYAIYRGVANEPERYGVQQETVDLVTNAVSGRKVAKRDAPSISEQEQLNEKDVKGLILAGRNKAGKLINQKLAYLERHPRKLEQESLVTLGKIFGILFDKSQIIQGQATEHVALMGKIDKDMDPETALQAVLQSREIIQSEKGG